MFACGSDCRDDGIQSVAVITQLNFHLGIGEVHDELNFVHPFTEVVPLGEDTSRRFAPKKHVKLFVGAVQSLDASLKMAWIFTPTHTK